MSKIRLRKVAPTIKIGCQNLPVEEESSTSPTMDALIAKADALEPHRKKRKYAHAHQNSEKNNNAKASSSKQDHTANSVVKHTAIPKSLQDTKELPEDASKYKHIANPKLRTHLQRQSAQGVRSKMLLEDAEMFLMEDAGGLVVENNLEKTWRVGQDQVVDSVGQEAARGRKEYKLDGGPYKSRYTRNGR